MFFTLYILLSGTLDDFIKQVGHTDLIIYLCPDMYAAYEEAATDHRKTCFKLNCGFGPADNPQLFGIPVTPMVNDDRGYVAIVGDERTTYAVVVERMESPFQDIPAFSIHEL